MIHRKEGYASILFLIIMSVLLPLGLFFLFELKQGFLAKDQMQSDIENAADAALWQVQHERLAKGEIVLDKVKAENTATQMLQRGWNEELSTQLPDYSIAMEDGEEFDFIDSLESSNRYEVKYPTVLIHSNFKAKGIFFSRFHDVKNETVSFVSWMTKPSDVEVPESTDSEDGVEIVTSSVVNPMNYPTQEGFPVREATELKLLGHSELQVSVNSNLPVVEGNLTLFSPESAFPSIVQSLTDNQATFYLPEGIEKGSEVSLSIQLTQRAGDGSLQTYNRTVQSYGEIVGQIPELLQVQKSKLMN